MTGGLIIIEGLLEWGEVGCSLVEGSLRNQKFTHCTEVREVVYMEVYVWSGLLSVCVCILKKDAYCIIKRMYNTYIKVKGRYLSVIKVKHILI